MKVFNTGRSYTDNGQIIAYMNYEGNTLFSDISRGIFGTINGTDLTESKILSLYDHGLYEAGFKDVSKLRELEAWALSHWLVDGHLITPLAIEKKIPRYADTSTISVKTLKGDEFSLNGWQLYEGEKMYNVLVSNDSRLNSLFQEYNCGGLQGLYCLTWRELEESL